MHENFFTLLFTLANNNLRNRVLDIWAVDIVLTVPGFIDNAKGKKWSATPYAVFGNLVGSVTCNRGRPVTSGKHI